MPSIVLTKDLLNDLKNIYDNPKSIFPQNNSLTFSLNFILLNTMWREAGFSTAKRERIGLSYAIGNFCSSFLRNGFDDKPFNVMFDGWSDLYEYYKLHKMNNRVYPLRALEPHFIVSIVSMFVVIKQMRIENQLIHQEFFNEMDYFLTTYQEIDIETTGVITSYNTNEQYEVLFTWNQYIAWLKTQVIYYDAFTKAYYESIISDQQQIYESFKEVYNRALWLMNKHIDNWRHGEFLLPIDKNGKVVNPYIRYTF